MPSIIVFPVAPTSEAQIIAGDVGITLQIPADVIQSLTGATACEIVITSPISTRHEVTATPSEDGTNATYSTIATDFPVAGTYSLQMQATFSSGAVLYTNEFTLAVGPRI